MNKRRTVELHEREIAYADGTPFAVWIEPDPAGGFQARIVREDGTIAETLPGFGKRSIALRDALALIGRNGGIA